MEHLPLQTAVPFWRNPKVVGTAAQVLFLAAVAAVAGLLYSNMLRGLDNIGLRIEFGFLRQEAGFGIAEGLPYTAEDSYARAFWVGAVNTIRVSVVGTVAATIIGLLVGLGRLSRNWLIRTLGTMYVESFRNVPLLLQILFWYSGVILQLPGVRQSIQLGNGIFINQRGVYVPAAIPTDGLGWWLILTLTSLALAVVAWIWLPSAARPTRVGRAAPLVPLVPVMVAVLAWLITSPFVFEAPQLTTFNFQGGWRLTPEFSALLLGLSMYSGAFIGEVVRGAVQSVSAGQREAARAVGLREGLVIRKVVLPQALRIMLPPLTSQYLNLAKNTSLAIAVGFPDLFNVGNTMMNQTGQALPVFGLIMASYLAMSLTTSLGMNWYNRTVRLVER